jgi:uncharacterized protein YjiS (DUF1127 family)
MKGTLIMVALARNFVAEVAGFGGLVERVRATVDVWNKRIAARRELAELSFRDIQDIGIDQAVVEQEVAKPFWRA